MRFIKILLCKIFGHEWEWTYTRNVGDKFDTRHGTCSQCESRWKD